MDVSDPQTLGFMVFGGFMFISAVGIALAPPAAAPKEKKKKKSAKVEPVVVVVETAAKEVLMMAVAPVVDVSQPKEAPAGNKKKNKNKPEPVTDSSLLYGELLSAVSNRTLSEDQTSKLMEVLNQKAGDSWQLACQKGDPLSTLKKQLEEKEKLRTAEQEVAAAAKTRLKELSKELGAEKSKMGSLDARLKAELSAQTQKLDAMRVSMEAGEQEHLKLTETLNQKVVVLQEQLENGPNAQLARLQQENSILRDALNQASSQAESRQNAELARLRSDCLHLSRELTERSDALRADEERRRGLEAKMTAAEQEAAQTRDTERALQQRLQEVMSELNAAQQEAAAVSELQGALALRDADLQELRAQLESQAAGQGAQVSEVEQLKHSVQLRDEQVGVLEAELTALRAELQLMTSQREEAAGEQREVRSISSPSHFRVTLHFITFTL
ncbi:Ribosome-binding protein 1 [Dissostichus eleginoides]|uniref:Ribosome-binding protein 1 n=1 Tax=Dissostichus eleginoides TaxID=100907 RepID=A0AAD9B488_DISEL|nr:Ribosome-binding protein 1 [Dissostichus eleginoides]